MRRFLSTKSSIVILTLLATVLVAGGVWAATGSSIRSQAGEVTPEIVVTPMVVQAGTPALVIAGSGFVADELMFFTIDTGGPKIFLNSLRGVTANENGAFFFELSALPSEIQPGVYTIKGENPAKGSFVVTHPLVVVEPK